MTKDGKALFLRRKGADHAGEWAFPGGIVEGDEELADAARREAMEEVGHLSGWDLAPLHRETRDRIDYTTFGQPVAMEFEPRLNDEHDAHEWRDLRDPPSPLHPGVASLLSKFFSEEAQEGEHAGSSAAKKLQRRFAGSNDGVLDDGKASHASVSYTAKAKNPNERCAICSNFLAGNHCKKVVDPIAPKGWCRLFKRIGATDSALYLALDKGSTRSLDSFGRMNVEIANISKANICPYKGEEIPGWEELGLERDKIYEMYRDPRELEVAAPTFNRIQILKKHVPVDVDDHQMWDIVGTTGSDAQFDGTYLTNSLSIWTKEGIDFIESGDQRELSCGYAYVPDMTPGNFGGKRYDGVMRQIEGNHVALVEEGRAGHDVVVGDSALDRRENTMKPTRLEAFLLASTARAVNPLLAKDAKIEYGPIFKGLTTANWKERRATIFDQIRKAVKGKTIAQDASLEHVKHFLDTFEHTPHAEKSWDESVSGLQHRAMEAAAHGHSNLGIPKHVGKEFEEADKGKKFGDMIRDWAAGKDWSGGMSDDDYAALDRMHMDAMTPVEEGAGMDGEEEVNIEVGEEEGEDAEISQSEGEEEAEDDEIEQSEEEEEAEDRHHADDRRHAKDRHAKDRRRGAKDRHAKDKHARDRRGASAMDNRPITHDHLQKALAAADATGRKRAQQEREAREFVRPYVGAVSMALDTAEGVLRSAAKIMNIEDADKIHASALKQLIKMAGAQTLAQDSRHTYEDHEDSELGMDEASSNKLDKMFPGMMRISQV